MKNILFIVVDAGYPDTIVVAVTEDQYADLQDRGMEISVEDEDWEDWESLFAGPNPISFPCHVDDSVVVQVY